MAFGVILGDLPLGVEGVHVGLLDLLRQRLDQRLLLNALDEDVDIGVGRHVDEVLDRPSANSFSSHSR
jgi:hypothetical protein